MAGELDSATGTFEPSGPIAGLIPKNPVPGKTGAANRKAMKAKGPVSNKPIGILPKGGPNKLPDAKFRAAQRKLSTKSSLQDIDQKISYSDQPMQSL